VLVVIWNRSSCVAYLHIVALVVVTAFTEEPVMYHAVNVELVQQWVAVLRMLATSFLQQGGILTLETEAVKTTTSYSSPTLFMN
jgi:hypothetical protein